MTAQENAVIVSKRLSLDPGKNIGNIGVQPLKGHITKAAVAFAVAVKVKPHAADALHSQGAGHLGEYRLIAAAGAAEAMQHNQHGKCRAAVRQAVARVYHHREARRRHGRNRFRSWLARRVCRRALLLNEQQHHSAA